MNHLTSGWRLSQGDQCEFNHKVQTSSAWTGSDGVVDESIVGKRKKSHKRKKQQA